MNKDHWLNFYKEYKTLEPSDFAKFVLNYIPKKSKILDMGCGTGRDSYFFGQKGMNVLGVDYASFFSNKQNVLFFKSNIKTIVEQKNNFDVIYSRFFLQAIEIQELKDFIKWSKGLFIAECRAKGDRPVLYKNHKRNFIDGNILIKNIISAGFDILYFKKGYNMAIRGKENPLIIRIIGKK